MEHHHEHGEGEIEHTDHRDMTDMGGARPTEHAAHQGTHAIESEMPGHAAHDQHESPEHAAMSHTGHEQHVDRAEHGDHAAHTDHTGHEQMFRRRFGVCLVLSIPVILYSDMIQSWLHFSMPAFPGSEWIAPLFSVIIFAYGGLPFLQMAVPELQNRQPGMMTLISLAIGVALVYSLAAFLLNLGGGFFWELVTLIDIMLLGHWLEMRSVRQASSALDELARLMPDTAERIRSDGTAERVTVRQLHLDDLVLVRPGQSVPADGEVVEGESEVNEAMITGESRPVKKSPGVRVIAGTVNGEGSLRIRVTAIGDKTALAGIMRLVRDAQQSKSRTQVLADRAAGWLFYLALGVALITGVAWTLAVGLNVEVLSRIATVLVIACPHALGLAIPLVIAITTALAASNGILIRNRLALEEARHIDLVIFDKTGTLTLGRQGVVAIATADGIPQDRALAEAAAVEGDSEHIIAQGIRQAAQQRGIRPLQVGEFQALKGKGAQARVDGHTDYVGGPRLLEQFSLKLPPALDRFTQDAEAQGQTVVYLVQGNRVAAAFALSDVVRPESKRAVDELHRMGIQVAMLTGDSEAVARAVAQELGIDQFFAQVLPENKDQKVVELQKQGKRVAMVGDGINDAPALARADVGIAIGGGTNVAIESAGIILVQSNPLDVVKIIQLSRASYRKMIENLLWATGYNVVALPLAAGILAPIGVVLSPAIGALFMSLSTIIVAINAQLLRRATLQIQ